MRSEHSGVSLRRTSGGWEFSSEQALENFVWEHLEALLQLLPFQRQYAVRGEICDILARTTDHQLVIIELKNTEDRYLVPQLTRYYANLLEAHPFAESIDYQHPIRLIAIAPSFHRHNFIDRRYSRLRFEFIQHRVHKAEAEFWFELSFDSPDPESVRLPIPYQAIADGDPRLEVGDIPEILVQWLSACSVGEQQALLAARQQILSFHPRLQERVGTTRIQYGAGQTQLCAELCVEKSRQRPILFLWLPLPSARRGERMGRLRIWTQDGIPTHVGHIPQGLGRMRLKEDWEVLPKTRWPRKTLLTNLSHRSMVPVAYRGYVRGRLADAVDAESLSGLVTVALEKWLAKL